MWIHDVCSESLNLRGSDGAIDIMGEGRTRSLSYTQDRSSLSAGPLQFILPVEVD